MPDFGALTMVGLIATILSIGFAIAAFLNSRRGVVKKKDAVKEDVPPGLPFLAPGKHIPENTSATRSPFYATASRRVSENGSTQPAFKQVQHIGAPSDQPAFNSDEYLWE